MHWLTSTTHWTLSTYDPFMRRHPLLIHSLDWTLSTLDPLTGLDLVRSWSSHWIGPCPLLIHWLDWWTSSALDPLTGLDLVHSWSSHWTSYAVNPLAKPVHSSSTHAGSPTSNAYRYINQCRCHVKHSTPVHHKPAWLASVSCCCCDADRERRMTTWADNCFMSLLECFIIYTKHNSYRHSADTWPQLRAYSIIESRFGFTQNLYGKRIWLLFVNSDIANSN